MRAPDFCRDRAAVGRRRRCEVPRRLSVALGHPDEPVYQNSPGIPITASYRREQRRDRAVARPQSVGLRDGAATCNANRTIRADPGPGAVRRPRAQQLDLRFTRTFRFGGTRRLRAEPGYLQLFNAATVLATNTTYGTAWRDVTQIFNGRLLRLGAQWDF